jgi:hypothetical protein
MKFSRITGQRRAFLAPIWLAALSVAIALGVFYVAARWATTTTTVVLVAASPAPDDARRLTALFDAGRDAGRLEQVYVAPDAAAAAMVATLVQGLGLKPETFDPAEPRSLARELVWRRRGTNSLVVGSRDFVVALARRLAGSSYRIELAPGDANSALVVTVSSFGPPGVLHLHF